jgi:hypothetical protein
LIGGRYDAFDPVLEKLIESIHERMPLELGEESVKTISYWIGIENTRGGTMLQLEVAAGT